jgi:hypothetical protein
MLDRHDMQRRARIAWIAVPLVGALLVGACGPAASVPAASTQPSLAATAATPTEATSQGSATVQPADSPPASAVASPTAAPSTGVVLNPTRCPATLPAPDRTTDDGIAIEGDGDFVKQVVDALELLEADAEASYADVVTEVTRVRQVESFSGMCYDTGTYRVGDETAYAPGHPRASQVIWLAGTIVHDGCHRARYVQGLNPSGKDAEIACLKAQAAALQGIDPSRFFLKYVRGLIDGADDPENQYWNNPNRHW